MVPPVAVLVISALGRRLRRMPTPLLVKLRRMRPRGLSGKLTRRLAVRRRRVARRRLGLRARRRKRQLWQPLLVLRLVLVMFSVGVSVVSVGSNRRERLTLLFRLAVR